VTVSTFNDFPLADSDRPWDGSAAEKRVRAWSGADSKPTADYRRAHVWYDKEKADNFTAYKLLIADVIDGELKVVPRAVMAAGAVMDGSRGGVDLPKADVSRVKAHLERYYRKMGRDAPWDQ
jgi:hypothetical protein